MAINVAINGFGRIGRMFFRAALNDKKIKIVAINDLTDPKELAYLLKYDSTHGNLKIPISSKNNALKIKNKLIPVFAQKDPCDLPWKKLKVDVVIEATGFFVDPNLAMAHIEAGAKKVLITAPAKPKNNKTKYLTAVLGVNLAELKKSKKDKIKIISNASCTTNCVAPILKVIDKKFGIKSCLFSTIHAYTTTQKLQDGVSKDPRKGRSATQNIIPTTTGADIATVKVLPNLKGKLKGMAFRVPISNGSVTDFVIETKKTITKELVNKAIMLSSKKEMKGIIEYTTDPLVSSDIIGNPHSAIFDSQFTEVISKNKLKCIAWYDNEWGYSCRLVDIVKLL
ncbi:type I glyceraldehyde-3-phosphate dehydrogenase [archaeon]|jgi:glyceraldehyde 3-phosphate dehydrogenase|nr:type I glyceraldehyde-3-phosphate dehydrogenase [archaeon]MBT6697626.1 type I glyceraldehyde-3-phosphate dehydrogenase [archaeon]